MKKKLVLVAFLLFLFVVPFFLGKLVFAEIPYFCLEVESVKCSQIGNFSDSLGRIEKKCGKGTLSTFQSKIASCEVKKENEIDEKDEELQDITAQENSAEAALGNINAGIYELNIEIANTNFSISQLEDEIGKKKADIKEFEDAISSQKKVLSNVIRQIYEYDEMSYVGVFLGKGTLSDFTEKIQEMDKIQSSLSEAISEIGDAKNKVNDQKRELQEKQKEKLYHKQAREYSKDGLVVKQQQQEYVIGELGEAKTPLEQEILKIEAELIGLRSAMSRIQSYLFATLGYNVSAEDIFNAVNNAFKETGVKPAFLLSILQMEGSIGKELYNTGSRQGNIQQCVDFCHPENCTKEGYNRKDGRCLFIHCAAFGQPQTERRNWCTREQDALEGICNALGINSNSDGVRITRDYGMGPAQIQPTTYQGNAFTGNPWDLNWAVLAIANICPGSCSAYHYVGYSSFNIVVSEWESVIGACGFNLGCPDLKERLESKF